MQGQSLTRLLRALVATYALHNGPSRSMYGLRLLLVAVPGVGCEHLKNGFARSVVV